MNVTCPRFLSVIRPGTEVHILRGHAASLRGTVVSLRIFADGSITYSVRWWCDDFFREAVFHANELEPVEEHRDDAPLRIETCG